MSLMLVGFMVWSAYAGQWFVAAAFVLVRAVGSLYAGTSKFPAEDGCTPNVARRVHVLRCVSSHAGDALGLVGLGFVLSAANRPVWGLAFDVAGVTLLLATLTRVASVQVGICLYRKATERVARRLSLIVGLVISGFVGHGVSPWVALAIIGPVAFAAMEFARTVSCLASEADPSVGVYLDVGSSQEGWELHTIWAEAGGDDVDLGTFRSGVGRT
jgi:hypothetical protein